MMPTDLILVHYDFSNYSEKARLALGYKGHLFSCLKIESQTAQITPCIELAVRRLRCGTARFMIMSWIPLAQPELMEMTQPILKLTAALAFLLALGGTARADAIDGNWCSDDGKHMTIIGPDITTPGGKQIKGNYTRHAFDYVVPAGEAGTGETVNILLRSEYLAVSRQGAADAPVREWRRCAERTS